ncbi:MAG TPA: DNA-processing protein DprA [Candidatus Nanopelagicales bacterium]|nr:DNA-processing protein DprA [Candidatus Nanopelagicales bacterium]
MSDDERRARALLSRLSEPADRRLGRLLAEMSATEVVELVRRGSARVPGVERFVGRLAAADPDADLARAAEVGGRLLVPGDLEWPSQLDDLGDAAPWALWVRGTVDLRLSALRSASVVGSRDSSRYGDHVASTLGSDLAMRGWTVVSGGAFGIDAAAHQGALAAGGVTVAVLACGIDVAYPPRHDALFARIAADGLLVSEVPPGAAPHRTRFLVRNRVIAALTRGTVVVEAALRSGALSTANEAEKLGRPVVGIPGPVDSGRSQGVHRLLRDGALLVTSAAEVVEALGELGTDLAPRPSGPLVPRDGLDPLTARVLDAVPARRPATLDSVARTAGVAPAEAAGALGLLEVGGFVRSDGSGWRLAPRGAPR